MPAHKKATKHSRKPQAKAAKSKNPIRKSWPRVTEVQKHGEVRFLVDGRPHKERKFFADRDEALVTAELWATERENVGLEGLMMPPELRRAALDAEAKLKPWGKTISDAVDHYIGALERDKQRREALTVDACIDRWLQHKQKEVDAGHRAPSTLAELRSKAKIFRKSFGARLITDITGGDVEDFLSDLPHAARGRYNIRTKLSQLFNFCRKRNWVSHNPTVDTEIKIPDEGVAILSVDEVKELLDAAVLWPDAKNLMPYILVGVFAGLRPGEAEGLRWERIDWTTNEIRILPVTSKARKERYVEMGETLRIWLESYKKRRGAIVGPSLAKDWRSIRAELGFGKDGEKKRDWPFNGLRHSYASYWIPIHGDRKKLAELMGNSVETLANHYRRAVPKSEAERFGR